MTQNIYGTNTYLGVRYPYTTKQTTLFYVWN